MKKTRSTYRTIQFDNLSLGLIRHGTCMHDALFQLPLATCSASQLTLSTAIMHVFLNVALLLNIRMWCIRAHLFRSIVAGSVWVRPWWFDPWSLWKACGELGQGDCCGCEIMISVAEPIYPIEGNDLTSPTIDATYNIHAQHPFRQTISGQLFRAWSIVTDISTLETRGNGNTLKCWNGPCLGIWKHLKIPPKWK